MLTLSRKLSESIILTYNGEELGRIYVSRIGENTVRLSFDLLDEVVIVRSELTERGTNERD